jgi:CheY-like chemotaxis protein
MAVKRALKELKVTNEIVRTVNGREAIEYLGKHSSKLPCVVLLDLNMPVMNGVEFLKIVKADERLRKIPVIVLTTSGEERDISESFTLGVAGYIVKPFSYEAFVDEVRILDLYWTLSELPKAD